MTAGLYIAKNFLNPILSNLADPDKEKHEQARQRAKAHLERINRERNEADPNTDGDKTSLQQGQQRVEELVLNEYENLIALEMVSPEDIHVGFDGELTQTELHRLAHVADKITRYWWAGCHYRGAEGVHHLPSYYASPLFACFIVVVGAFRCFTLRPSWMW